MSTFYELAKEAEPKLVKFLRDIIAIPSLSCQEERVIKRAEREMHTLGYDEVTVDPMGNLIGRIGQGPVAIAYDGHIDTVDISEPTLWETDPYDPAIINGFIRGRGTTDMKGGVCTSIYAAALMKERGLVPENASLYVTATVQEEDCDGLCWQYIVNEDKLKPDVVVITEPTDRCIFRGQRGRMEIEVSTAGLSAHGSAPARGANAVYKMADIIDDIANLNWKLKSREPLGKGSVTISQIRSTSPSLCAVADGCTIHLDRRLTLQETEETSVAELEALPSVQKAKAVVKVLQYDTPSFTGLSYPTKKYFPTWQMDMDHPAVVAAIEAHRSVFHEEPRVGHWTFSTNGVATAGMHRIPTVGYGPGEEKFAHAPNERVAIEDLVRCTAFYMGFAEAYAATAAS